MIEQFHQRHDRGVYAYDMITLPWVETGKPGVRLKPVREDGKGSFMGLVQFDPMTSSGVHQHHGPATSLMFQGSISDYQESYGPGTVSINLDGTTHDAISWEGAFFVSRLEGPTSYLPVENLQAIHSGGSGEIFFNPAPEVLPAIDFQLMSARQLATSIPRLSRRMLFDYAVAAENHRYVELTLWPEMLIPTHRVSDLTEWVVLAGGATINNVIANQGSIVVIEPGTEVTIESRYGCRLLAWADGPIAWSDGQTLPDIYGF